MSIDLNVDWGPENVGSLTDSWLLNVWAIAATAGLPHTVHEGTEGIVAATQMDPSVHVGTAVDCYPTGSAISCFPTGGSSVIPELPPGLTSVPHGVFYTGYAGTGTGYFATSAPNSLPTLRLSSSSGVTAEATSRAVKTGPLVSMDFAIFLLALTGWMIL